MLKTTHTLSFKIKIPHLKTELRRLDEEFEIVQAYLVKAYPNVLVAPIKQYKPQK